MTIPLNTFKIISNVFKCMSCFSFLTFIFFYKLQVILIKTDVLFSNSILMTESKKPNYKAFIPIGITFIGSGIVFMTAVNPAIGIAMAGVGIAFIAIGVNHKRRN